MRFNKKWKKAASGILAVCLVLTLLLANQSFGVLAEEDDVQTQESMNEENSEIDSTPESIQESGETDISESGEPENNENVIIDEDVTIEDGDDEQEDDEIDIVEAEDEGEVSEAEKDFSEFDSGEDAALYSEDAVSKLIDADEELLRWKRTKESNIQVSAGNQSYNVNDDSSFSTAYTAVCKELKKAAAPVTDSIHGQTITGDTVWDISGTVNMNGAVKVNEGARLVILGTGTISRTDAYEISTSGTLILQESVYLNGNNLSNTLISMEKGTTYLTDDFHIGNCPSATGVVTTGGTLEMSGGLVGTKNISFEWKDENDESLGSKNYEDTLNYIEAQINSKRYDYVSDIAATEGCIRGIQIGRSSQFYMSGGVIAGNIGNSGLYLSGKALITGGMIFGNVKDTERTTSQGGAIDCINALSIQIMGGKIYANHATGYGGAINVGRGTVFGKNMVLAYNSAQYNGGAVVVNAGKSLSVQDNARITHNTAIGKVWEELAGSGNGGAFRVVGTLEILGGIVSYNYANGKIETNLKYLNSGNGGAISAQTDSDVRIADIKLKGGFIEHNKSRENGGAIWIASMVDSFKATFSLEGTAIRDNIAGKQGGGAYLAARKGDFLANIISGTLSTNSAGTSGGGMYLELGDVNGSLGKSITVNIGEQNGNDSKLLISNNKAQENGGALYIGRSEKNTSENNTIDVNFYSGTMQENRAANGGGIGIVQGALTLYGGATSSNTATENGGGVYLSGGNLVVSGGSFAKNGAQNGGGVFLNAGHMTLSGGRIYNNLAVNGAGAYLNGGNLTMSDGYFDSNTASGDGGGAYLANGALTINGGAFDHNTALNGGGAYVSDGNVRMFGGNIINNTASQDGGGFYVSSNNTPADVVIRSGTISGNKAGDAGTASTHGNGGAIAVVSSSENNTDHVIVGLRHQHPALDMVTRGFTSFEYKDEKDNNTHTHASCPIIKDNQAVGNGGGIYMASSQSILDVYCLLEEKNTAAADKTGGSIMSVGGHVNIGDVGEGNGENSEKAVGNIYIQSSMLVKGGNVIIYGNTDNPKFADKILVDIRQTAGSFEDRRFTQPSDDKSYKIEFFENFEDSGAFTSMQYTETDDITAMGNMYEHKGYKIIGWNTEKNGNGTMYTTGSLIASNNDHRAWEGKENTAALTLYAIWTKISYTVAYEPNADVFSGEKTTQTFQYGEKQVLAANPFAVTGKRFNGWNTEKNGSGTPYDAAYDESEMTATDGATVTLYAQWVDCTHKDGEHPGSLSYKADAKTNSITENCDCGGHTVSVTISGADVYYDGKAHPASLRYTGDFLYGSPEISYLYKENADTEYGKLDENQAEPTQEGYYKASITVNGATVFVEYQIKSPAEAATIDVTTNYGQHFMDIQGKDSCTVFGDDAFTVQYDVQSLNAGTNSGSQKAYRTAPVLSLSQELPAGTTIIMQTDNAYWYNSSPKGTEISVESFNTMGAETQFSYDTSDSQETQKYRFIIDFSNVAESALLKNDTRLTVGLKYAYTNSTTGTVEAANDIKADATISIADKTVFEITATQNTCTVKAPASVNNTRWEQKNLVWKIVSANANQKLPADARLTLTTTENQTVKTATYTMNADGEFVIPFSWTGEQSFSFALSSGQESLGSREYALKAVLCVGSKTEGTVQPAAVEDNMEKASDMIELAVPVNNVPSLKISGTDRVLSSSENLNVTITYKNVNDYTVNAVIQKKDSDGVYKGKYYEETIAGAGTHAFSLKSTDGAGSYRLWITVSRKISETEYQTLLEVPYYFIVQ